MSTAWRCRESEVGVVGLSIWPLQLCDSDLTGVHFKALDVLEERRGAICLVTFHVALSGRRTRGFSSYSLSSWFSCESEMSASLLQLHVVGQRRLLQLSPLFGIQRNGEMAPCFLRERQVECNDV